MGVQIKENATVEFFKAGSLAARSTLEAVPPPAYDDNRQMRMQRVSIKKAPRIVQVFIIYYCSVLLS